jgi:thiol-disulfide isomerase/thioredoxin
MQRLTSIGAALLACAALTSTLAAESAPLPDQGPMPDLTGATAWLNSAPLNRAALKGKVVLIDFWTYTCINCLRALPYVKAWAAKYGPSGLVVIGVHTPEFAFEGERSNVVKAVRDLKVSYPVALDSDYKIWQAFNNQFWPAHYFIDAQGRIRYRHFGEGKYDVSEQVIQQLLAERAPGQSQPGRQSQQRTAAAASNVTQVAASGIEAAANEREMASPETYVGYARAENFNSPQGLAHDKSIHYTVPARSALNQWSLGGVWKVGAESAVLQATPGKIVFRFHARDLHLVLAPAQDGTPVRFKVRLDGAEPGADHGVDVGADGGGVVRENRLHQLVRQTGRIEDRTFEIEFLDPGVQAFAFTFG